MQLSFFFRSRLQSLTGNFLVIEYRLLLFDVHIARVVRDGQLIVHRQLRAGFAGSGLPLGKSCAP